MTKYARDEFDRVPETSARQGVHRTVAESRRRRLWPILAVGAAALAIGLVAFLILPKLGFTSAGTTAAAAAGQGSSATAEPSPDASSAGPSSAAPSAVPSAAPSAEPSASATPSDTPEATAALDKTQPVAVYNGTTTAGLAGRVGGTLTTAGWVLGPTGNWGGVRQQTSVIFYSTPAQKGNAEALGSLLGIATTVQSAEFKMPLVVVLGPGFQ